MYTQYTELPSYKICSSALKVCDAGRTHVRSKSAEDHSLVACGRGEQLGPRSDGLEMPAASGKVVYGVGEWCELALMGQGAGEMVPGVSSSSFWLWAGGSLGYKEEASLVQGCQKRA